MTETADDLKVQADTEAGGPGGETGAGSEAESLYPGDQTGVDQFQATPEEGIQNLEESYRLDAPGGMNLDDELLTSFRKSAARHGLSPEAFNDMTGLWSGYVDQLESTAEALKGQSEDQLTGEWGSAYEGNLSQAQKAAQRLGGSELIEFLNESGLGNYPPLIKAFWQAGRMISEDRLATGPRSGVGSRRSAAEILYGSN